MGSASLPERLRSRLRPALAALVVALLVVATVGAAAGLAGSTWSRNLYNRNGYVYQDPYPTACTAAALMMMLNFTALAHTGGNGFVWTNYRVQRSADPTNYRDMTSILYFERTHDTLRSTSAGSDAHGWRNALNYYGWGKAVMTDPSKRVYDDLAFGTFTAAVKAAIRAIARFHKPVGILGWGGQHAQVITGYIVTGADPALSNDFTIKYIYLSDPLRSDYIRNKPLTLKAFQSGDLHYRFQHYRETDSPKDDWLSAGWRRSSVVPTVGPSEWYHRWVIIAPIRDGVPDGPTSSPTPSPSPGPSASPTPSPSAGTDGTTPTPTPTTSAPPPTATDSPTPADSPTPSVSPAQSASPTPTQ